MVHERDMMVKVTPFKSIHEQLGAAFDEYHGWEMPSHYGSVENETEALHNQSAAVDLSSFGRFSLKGTGADEAIKKITGNGETLPEPGQWKSYADIRVACTDKGFTVLTMPQARQKTFDILSESENSDLKVADITERTAMLGLYGPGSVEKLDNIVPLNIGEIEQGKLKTYVFFMMPVTIIAGSWTGVQGVELICPVTAASLAGGAIVKYRNRENIVPAGMESLLRSLKNCRLTPSAD